MRFIQWQVLVMAAFVGLTCFAGREKIVVDSANVAAKKGVVAAWATWVKDKGKKYDLNFHIRNDSQKFIIVMLHDIECSRGKTTGELKYTFFNTGERTIDLSPGQDKGANMVCAFPGPVTGDFKVSIRRVFDNPSADRATPGKMVASDLVWKQNESGKADSKTE